MQRIAGGAEAGAKGHRASLPPTLPFGLSEGENFECSESGTFLDSFRSTASVRT